MARARQRQRQRQGHRQGQGSAWTGECWRQDGFVWKRSVFLRCPNKGKSVGQVWKEDDVLCTACKCGTNRSTNVNCHICGATLPKVPKIAPNPPVKDATPSHTKAKEAVPLAKTTRFASGVSKPKARRQHPSSTQRRKKSSASRKVRTRRRLRLHRLAPLLQFVQPQLWHPLG